MKKKSQCFPYFLTKFLQPHHKHKLKAHGSNLSKLPFFFFFHYTKEDDKQGTKRALEERQYKV